MWGGGGGGGGGGGAGGVGRSLEYLSRTNLHFFCFNYQLQSASCYR